MKEIDDSIDRIVAGMEGKPLVDGKAKSLVAYHEVHIVLESHGLHEGMSCSSAVATRDRNQPLIEQPVHGILCCQCCSCEFVAGLGACNAPHKLGLGPWAVAPCMGPTPCFFPLLHGPACNFCYSCYVAQVGHAICGTLTPGHDPVQKVTLIPRGQARGLTWFIPGEDPSLISKSQVGALLKGVHAYGKKMYW